MLATLVLLAHSNTQAPSGDVAAPKAYIEREFAGHVRVFKDNNPDTLGNFWFRNCLVGYQQVDALGKRVTYSDVFAAFQQHPLHFEKNLDRTMRLVKIEKVKDGFAVMSIQGWTAVIRSLDPDHVHPKFQVRSILQQLWVKTRKGFGLKFTEILDTRTNDSGRQYENVRSAPAKIWNGATPVIPAQVMADFRKPLDLSGTPGKS